MKNNNSNETIKKEDIFLIVFTMNGKFANSLEAAIIDLHI